MESVGVGKQERGGPFTLVVFFSLTDAYCGTRWVDFLSCRILGSGDAVPGTSLDLEVGRYPFGFALHPTCADRSFARAPFCPKRSTLGTGDSSTAAPCQDRRLLVSRNTFGLSVSYGFCAFYLFSVLASNLATDRSAIASTRSVF